MILTKKPEVNG